MTHDYGSDAVGSTHDHARFADWDAAYLLGALSSSERAEFEQHRKRCGECEAAVMELAGLPGMLSRVESAAAHEFLAQATAEPADDRLLSPARALDAVPDLPPDLVERVSAAARERPVHWDGPPAERRWRRRLLTGLVAAVVVIGVGLSVPWLRPTAPTPPTAAVQLASPAAPQLTAQVQLYSEPWGTRIDMTCSYADEDSDGDSHSWMYGLYVVDRQGNAQRVSSWTTAAGSTVHTTSATAVPAVDIADVQLRSESTGTILLTAPVG